MFSFKKKYYLIIQSIKDIDLKKIKKRSKFIIIYRNQKNSEDKADLLLFRKKCKMKSIEFYVANNLNLAIFLRSDGVYLSSYNKSFKALSLEKLNFKIIGSAHTYKEIYMKVKQGCKLILLSKLFLVDYDKKSKFLGIIKFNNLLKNYKYLIPLGGINQNNFISLKTVSSKGFALMSAIKKKPANIINRLF